MDGKAGFKDRANAVFSALNGENGKNTTWALAENQIFEAGRDANYSSDEERDAEQRESEIPSTLFFEGTENENGQHVMPSNSFCRALDAEPEMDVNDNVAEGLSYSRKERIPSRKMEVLDDNIFDRQSKAAENREISNLTENIEASNSMDIHTPMQIDISMPSSSSPRQDDSIFPDAATKLRLSAINENWMPQNGNGMPQNASIDKAIFDVSTLGKVSESRPRRRSEGDKKSGRKVRFGDTIDIPEYRRENSEPKQSQNSGSGLRKPSYVPDHVRNPHKYTTYVLEEPILVGSGNDGSKFAQKENTAQITNEANLSSDFVEDDRSQPDFKNTESEQIVFNPARRKAQANNVNFNPSADRVNKKPLALENETGEEDTQLEDEDMHSDKPDAPEKEFKSKAKRNRNLRKTERE